MSRAEFLLLVLASAAAGGTGLILHVMKNWMVVADPFAVIHHPWQPLVLKAHLLTVPWLVFAVGLVAASHVLPRWRGRTEAGRRSGLATLWVLTPMVFSGVLIQVVVDEAWLQVVTWSHLATGSAYLAALLLHRRTATGRRREAGSRS